MNIRYVATTLLAITAFAFLSPSASARRPTPPFPQTISLPDGFFPEGITTGRGGSLYVGSIPSGAVYRANAFTGDGEIVVAPQEGRSAIGLDYDGRTQLLYVAGGATGKAFIYHAQTGVDVAELTATEEPAFVNDAIVTGDAVYFTDSFRPVFYRLELGPGGRLPEAPVLDEVVLGGEFEFLEGEFNSNGIVATASGNALLIVNSVTGTLYRVNPSNGEAIQVDLGALVLSNGDGMLLLGQLLYVVRNFDNQISVVALNHDFTSGELLKNLTDDDFDVPTTVANVGPWLYAPNARFSTDPTPQTEYQIVRLPAW